MISKRILFSCILGAMLIPHVAQAGDITITVGSTPVKSVNRRIFGGAYNDTRGNKDDWAKMGLTTCREGAPGLQSPGRLEPQEGVWQWKDYDNWLDWLRTNKITGIALLGAAADWMLKGGDKKPADWNYFIESWAKFAAEVVRHTNIEHKAGIRYWEIWNEPDASHWFGADWGGDPPHYSALFNAAVKAMKAVDPTIKVGTGGIADPYGGSLKTWWEPCLRDGGVNKTLDFVCLHGYYGDPTNKYWYVVLDRARGLMHQYVGREIPIWITEFNADCHENFVQLGTPFDKQALYVAETLAIFAAEKIDAAQYFCIGWYGSDFCPWNTAEGGSPRPVVDAYKFWTDYRGKQLPVKVSGANQFAAVACRDKRTTTVYFPADNPGSFTIQLPNSVEQAGITATAFTGNSTEKVSTKVRNSAVRLDWPEGKRALIKVQIREY